jgi:hypothetical protein
MSNPIQAAAAPSDRPRVVTVARGLTFLIALLLAVAGIAFLSLLLTTSATITGNNTQNLSQDQLNQYVHVLGAIGAVFFFVLVAGQITAAMLMGRASNAGRVTAWVVDGLTLLCCGCGLGTSFLGNGNVSTTTNNTSETIHFTTSGSAGALGVVIFGATGIGILASIAVIILLVLPEANEYFRRPQAVWSPTQWAGGPAGGYGQPPSPYGQPGSYPPPGVYGPPPGGESQPGWQRPTLPPPPGSGAAGAGAPGSDNPGGPGPAAESPRGSSPYGPPPGANPYGPPPGAAAHPASPPGAPGVHPGPSTPPPPSLPPAAPTDPTAPPPDQQR